MLDRVKVLRIFDVAGLVDALGEIMEICEDSVAVMEEGSIRRTVIADSEDDLSVDEDGPEASSSGVGEQAGSARSGNDHGAHFQKGGIGMVLVDTVANIFGPVMAKSQVQGR